MQLAVLTQLSDWHDFYSITGTAAATLTGLMFIAITLLASVRARVALPHTGIAAFNTPTVVHFGGALLIAALLSAPWTALWPVGVVLAMVGVAGGAYVVFVARRPMRWTGYQPVLEDRLWHIVFPLIAYVGVLVAAMMLTSHPHPMLFIVGAAQLLLILIGIHNAWDNVTYIVVSFTQPPDSPASGSE